MKCIETREAFVFVCSGTIRLFSKVKRKDDDGADPMQSAFVGLTQLTPVLLSVVNYRCMFTVSYLRNYILPPHQKNLPCPFFMQTICLPSLPFCFFNPYSESLAPLPSLLHFQPAGDVVTLLYKRELILIIKLMKPVYIKRFHRYTRLLSPSLIRRSP
ncbi:hypothetical protein BDZ91DRAFT_494328 [Kalaharituber pfeilii]|nr:hypothetical protein BDZ91DRAFT_494328 [Kalaharituber pfeilii]